MKNPEKAYEKLIKKCKICYISYVDENGYPVTKAMLKPRGIEGKNTFYFSTNTSSNKVKCLLNNPKASVYFVNTKLYRGLSLCGTAEVLETDEIKKRFWHLGDRMYYRGGVTDPDYCILKFTAEKGRYYSNFKNSDFEI